MPKRRVKTIVKTSDVAQRLRKAMARRTKDQLVDVLVELASKDRQILRRLTERIDLEASPQVLAAATRERDCGRD